MSSSPRVGTSARSVSAGPAAENDPVLWRPDGGQLRDALLTRFIGYLNVASIAAVSGYDDLHEFSLAEPSAFWSAVWDFADIRGTQGNGPPFVRPADRMHETEWFPGSRVNLAENLLARISTGPALIAHGEEGHRRTLTGDELASEVYRCMAALEGEGVGPGDRVAGYLPNIPEAVVAAIAAVGLGATWSVCSPDQSPPAVREKLRRLDPKVVFVTAETIYAGRRRSLVDGCLAIARELPGLERLVSTPGPCVSGPGIPSASWMDWLPSSAPTPDEWTRFPYRQPAYVVFTSGTTGVPKGVVHGAGGVLLKHAADYMLHYDVRPGDTCFQHTSTSWMLWNAHVSALSVGAAIVLYDGSPFHPGDAALLDICEANDVTMLGVSPHVIERWAQRRLCPKDTHDLEALRCVSAGGAPLSAAAHRYVYDCIKRDVHLMSPSGGTEILSFFAGGNPIGPCVSGEIQVRALGMAVDVYDETGAALIGEPGELVCTAPFPSMPLGLLGDADDHRLIDEYFSMYPDVWRHGDRAIITERGGVKILGRSDATLNVKGIRLGTAEIYSQITMFDEIAGSAVIEVGSGLENRMVLFLQMHVDHELDAQLEARIRDRLRTQCSPRHVPELIVQVPELIRSENGKVLDVVIRDVVNGRPGIDPTRVGNPAAVSFFENLSLSGQAATQR